MESIPQNATAPINTTIHVLLVDNSRNVRRALRLALNSESDLRVVGEAASGEQAVRLACDLHPDIILMDLELPGMSGLDATRCIKAAGAVGAIIMLTAWGGDAIRGAAAQAGIALFIEKGDDLAALDDLAGIIRALHEHTIQPSTTI